MTLFSRGRAAKYLRLGSEHILHAYLGEDLVFDGTVPAFVAAPKAAVTAAARAPAVSSSPAAVIAPVAAATVDAVDPAPRASSVLAVVPAEAELAGIAPAVRVDMTVAAVVATSSAEAIPTVSDAQVSVPTALVAAAGVVPNVETTGSAIVLPPPAGSLVDTPAPIVSASKTIVTPTATSAAAGRDGTGFSAGLTTPAASASASAATPVVTAVNFLPSGMNRNTTQTANFGTTYAQVLGWNADTTNYPGSSVVSSDLIAQTAATNATIQVSLEVQNTAFATRLIYMQLKVNGTSVGESPEFSMTSNSTATHAWSVTGLTIPAGAAIRLEARCPNANQTRSTGNTASYVRLIQP